VTELRYLLLSDGSSDRCLLSILTWLLRESGVASPIQPDWADLRRLPRPPRDLPQRIRSSLELYPCDLLFVHRDAEGPAFEARKQEILGAIAQLAASVAVPAVCVVPVRMQEAWLLLDEAAIRAAAGNPAGRETLSIPPLRQLEQIPDPKEVLHRLLREASGLGARCRQTMNVRASAQRVSEFVSDFSRLRALAAFVALENDVGRVVTDNGWSGGILHP